MSSEYLLLMNEKHKLIYCMKKELLLACSLCWGMLLNAERMEINTFHYAGPYPVKIPYQVDTVNVNSEPWKADRLLKTPLSLETVEQGKLLTSDALPVAGDGYALYLLGFTLENTRYGKAELKVEGVESYQVYVDGKWCEDLKLTLEPASHRIIVKYLSAPGQKGTPKLSVDTEKEGIFTLTQEEGRLYTLADVLHGKRYTDVEVSPDGKYLILAYRTTRAGGQSANTYVVRELATGRVLAERSEELHWMPRSSEYYLTRQGVNGKELVRVHPSTGAETVLSTSLPEGSFRFAPTEDYLLFSLVQEGPKEKKEIYEYVDPDDRQPGWRDRTYLAKYDLASGLMQPLTYGYRQVFATDISADGSKVLMMVTKRRLEARPTTLFSLYMLDVHTLESELLVEDDGFISNALFSPDARQVLIAGSPESLGGIGKNVKEGQTPSMVDTQLYLMEVADKSVKPLTLNFHPNVMQTVWNKADGKVYFTAENRDYYSLYQMEPASGSIRQVEVPEDMVLNMAVASQKPVLAFYGESVSNSHRLYSIDLKNRKPALVEDLSKDILKDIRLGSCEAWNFVNSRGDTIYGRYYLPPHFDANRKYPMIVNYYGGCSPTSRNFESRYPHHAYAALGYVVYVIEPSGATGFGQEFSARHVNTFGDGVADDIIEGTRKFAAEHAFVDDRKIGCIGASYGGFMTQYLQTKTDIFAAAISHAGISDHTSYWGEGYWGYSYSEVSGANSYPWKNKELFVDHSPLFNADKIHTPLLFLHGSVDMNVPVGESIQMYTALKLLGRETALVVVDGQDHHIVDYNKRIQWQNTIFAWFAKWLQDDPSWWNALYRPKSL